jgi:ATPase subunit of ABC transporter with duplicated ATPase domains
LDRSHNFAIQTQGLCKVYGTKVAVRSLSLAVPRGSIFGFLGPNGAGKTTSIKMLLGLVKPTGGQTYVLDAPPGDVRVRRKICSSASWAKTEDFDGLLDHGRGHVSLGREKGNPLDRGRRGTRVSRSFCDRPALSD